MPNCASSNYAMTLLTLSSMLNAEYVQNIADLPPTLKSGLPAKELIANSRVLSSLKTAGYRVVWVGSGVPGIAAHPMANQCACPYPWVGPFEASMVYLMRSPNRHAIGFCSEDMDPLPEPRTVGRARVAAACDAHIHVHSFSLPPPTLCVRTRRVAAAQPRPVSFLEGRAFAGTPSEYRFGYASQAAYIPPQVLKVVDHLVATAPPDSIFIVHGDHGPRSSFNPVNPTVSDPTEIFPVFLAMRGPGVSDDEDSPVTLVNVVQQTLSRLGADLPDLPDRHFMSSGLTPLNWVEASGLPCPDR